MLDFQTMELLEGLRSFNPNKGKLYSYAYRIGYTSALHYYQSLVDDYRKKQAIEEHWYDELEQYMEEYSDHKVKNINREA